MSHVAGNLRSTSKVVWKKRFRLWRRNVKQWLSIGQSEGAFCEKPGIQLAHSRVPHLPIPTGWKKRRYESTLTQLSVTNSMAKVHSSEGHQAELNGNIGIIALCFGEGALQVSTFLGTSTTPSPRLVWFLVGPAPNQMETAYDCSKNQTFKFAWRAQNARRLWTGCNGSSLCMVLVWCCNKPSQTVPLTRLLRTERSGAHLKAQMRDPIGLATGSQKEVSCNSTWIHCQLRVRQQAWRQATP